MKKQPKMTPWFDGSVKPVHVGVYERNKQVAGRTFQFWDGNSFGACSTTPEIAATQGQRSYKSGIQTQFQWRGLTKAAA